MITRGVLSRSMFNRNARNKLYNKGGLASVQKFRFGGVPKLPPVGMEDYKFLNDMIRSGNVQGLQSILQKNKPGRIGGKYSSLPYQMRNIAKKEERKLNPPLSMNEILRWAFPKMWQDENQNTDTTKEDTTAAEDLNNLTSRTEDFEEDNTIPTEIPFKGDSSVQTSPFEVP